VFVGHAAQTLATRALLLLAGAAANVFVARALGPAGRGYYAVALAVTGLGVQLASLGLHASNTYDAARGRGRIPALVANSVRVAFVGGVGALVVLAGFLLRPHQAPLYGSVAVLALAAVPVGVLALLLQSILLGAGEVRAYNTVQGATGLGAAALVAVWVLAGWTSIPLLMAASLAMTGAGALWVWVRLRRLELPPGEALPGFRASLRYGGKAYAAGILMLLVQRADLFLLTRIEGSQATGLYASAASVALVLSVIPAAVGTVLFPRLAALRDEDAQWSLTRRVLGATALATALPAAALWVGADTVVRLLFGPAFAAAAEPLRFLLPGVLILSINSVLMNWFASRGMPAVTVASPAVALATVVSLDLVLIPRLGIVGAAIGASAASALMLAMSLAYIATLRRRA
jgi:O-antigen/teichoic acid export membrane protein